MSSAGRTDGAPGTEDAAPADEPRQSFGPTRAVVLATLVAAILFGVILEFLMAVSFIGRRIWHSPRLGADPIFTLPLVLWAAVVVLTVLTAVGIISQWLRIGAHGISVHGLLRRTRTVPWQDISRVILVHDIVRGSTPVELLDRGEAWDGLYILDREETCRVTVSGRRYGVRAQRAVVRAAESAGIEIQEVPSMDAADLNQQLPGTVSPTDAHPRMALLLLVGFYLVQYLLTFFIWGL